LVAYLGYALALLLRFGGSVTDETVLVLPLWVLLMSSYIADDLRRPSRAASNPALYCAASKTSPGSNARMPTPPRTARTARTARTPSGREVAARTAHVRKAPNEQRDYPSWKVKAAKELKHRHDIEATAIAERIWVHFYVHRLDIDQHASLSKEAVHGMGVVRKALEQIRDAFNAAIRPTPILVHQAEATHPGSERA
jgi:hypothetical protein